MNFLATETDSSTSGQKGDNSKFRQLSFCIIQTKLANKANLPNSAAKFDKLGNLPSSVKIKNPLNIQNYIKLYQIYQKF